MARALSVAVLVLAAAMCVRAAVGPKCFVSPIVSLGVGKNHGCAIDSAGPSVTVPKGVQGCTSSDGCEVVPATGGQVLCWGQTSKGQFNVPGAKYSGYLSLGTGGDITCEWRCCCLHCAAEGVAATLALLDAEPMPLPPALAVRAPACCFLTSHPCPPPPSLQA